jgi:hypothetical protein
VKSERAVRIAGDLIALFVHSAVMIAAEEHEIGEGCRPAISPMADVMCLDES